MTYEQAQNFLPMHHHLDDSVAAPRRAIARPSKKIDGCVAPASHTTTVLPLVTNGERIPTSRGWQSVSRAEFGINKASRCWKRHRVTQRAGARV
jgi:hypothetical protein